MSWDDADFSSPDPLVRFNAHQEAKGRAPLNVDAWDNRDKTIPHRNPYLPEPVAEELRCERIADGGYRCTLATGHSGGHFLSRR